jgi:hypothetical protein
MLLVASTPELPGDVILALNQVRPSGEYCT